MTRVNADVAVIGSGAAGLAAAYGLHKAGHRVKLFERNDELGGRIKTLYRDGFTIEEGPTQMVRSYTTILGIIEDSGMGGDIIPASSLLGMLDASKTTHDFSIEHVYGDMAKTRLLTVREKLDLAKLGFDVLRNKKNLDPEDLSKMHELDHMSALDYGRKRFNSSVFDNFVDPVVRGFTGTAPANVSASCMLFVFATFMNKQHFVALRGGMASYPAHLARLFEQQLGAQVVEVEEHAGDVDVTWRDADGKDHTESFEGVVIATQPKLAGQIHVGLDPWRREFLTDHVAQTSIVATHVALDRPPAAPASMVYSTERSDLTNVLAIGLEHNKVPAHIPAGKAVATIYAAGDWSLELLEDHDDESVTRKLIEAGEQLVPGVSEQALFTHVSRWPYAWFQSYPGYWKQMRKFREVGRREDRRVHLAGDYFCTTSLNVASTAGARAARELLASVPAASPVPALAS
jgi:oxygen-dependent protoporphyrinogen oxidase